MPHNYVIDSEFRDGMKELFKNAVIIFDEAHNVISVAEESQSFGIDSSKLKEAIDEMQWFQDNIITPTFTGKSTEDELDSLMEITDEFKNYLVAIDFNTYKRTKQRYGMPLNSCAIEGS